MTIYRIADWEANGYDDSDFFESHYDTETGTLDAVEVGSTRYAGLCPERVAELALVRPISEAPLEVVEAIRKIFVSSIHGTLVFAEERDCEPQDANKGNRLKLAYEVKHKGEKIAAGLAGTVFWCGAFGKFYRNGYNKPGRHNRRVGLKLDDGRSVFVALKACNREKPAESSEALLVIAERISWKVHVAEVIGCRAWLTHDWITPCLAKLKASLVIQN
jgi:hypothetical protein